MSTFGTDFDSLQPHIATAYSVVFVGLKKLHLKSES